MSLLAPKTISQPSRQTSTQSLRNPKTSSDPKIHLSKKIPSEVQNQRKSQRRPPLPKKFSRRISHPPSQKSKPLSSHLKSIQTPSTALFQIPARTKACLITRLEATTLCMLGKCFSGDMSSSKNSVGAIFQLCGFQRTISMTLTLLLRSKSRVKITLKLPMMKSKFWIKSVPTGRSKSGKSQSSSITQKKNSKTTPNLEDLKVARVSSS